MIKAHPGPGMSAALLLSFFFNYNGCVKHFGISSGNYIRFLFAMRGKGDAPA
jgi:hypothetical protein